MFRFPTGAGNIRISLRHRDKTGSGAQMFSGGTFLGVERLGLEADHSLPSSVEVKNAWSYTSTPPYAFM
jgi:hypothetical protein